MTVIVRTETKIALVHPQLSLRFGGYAAVDVVRGQLAYLNSSGNYGLADGSASGTAKARGVFLTSVSAGEPVSMMKMGWLFGYTVSALAYDAVIYVSDTEGEPDTAAGTVPRAIGCVVPVSDTDKTKIAFFDFPWVA